MKPTPSIAALTPLFGDHAKEAKIVLGMSRAELSTYPVAEARIKECYHPPTTADIRMTVLNWLAGTHGVEGFELTKGPYRGTWLDYLNTGETYAATLVRVGGRYRIGCWGDYAERYT